MPTANHSQDRRPKTARRRMRVLLVLAVFIGYICPASSDSRIVFSAQRYRRASQQALVPVGKGHRLYLVDPKSLSLSSLTNGDFDDQAPAWSPDRKNVLFLRSLADGRSQLCTLTVDSRRVRAIIGLGSIGQANYKWSPDGKTIGLVRARYGAKQRWAFSLLSCSTWRPIRTILGPREFSWSPDSSRVLLRFADRDKCSVLDLKSMRITPLPICLKNTFWLSSNCILGILVDGSQASFVVVDARGNLLRRLFPKFSDKNAYFGPDSMSDYFLWHKIPGKKDTLLLEVLRFMSDGTHSQCYQVNLNDGAVRSLGEIEFGGFSRNGREFASSLNKWVGPYKRGGQRLGRLGIMSRTSGEFKRITSTLMDIRGASWYSSVDRWVFR